MRERMNKQSSFIMVSHNPLESGILSDHVTIKAENLNDAKLISEEELNQLFNRLSMIEENEERLDILEYEKLPFLFSSDHLAKLIDITPSIKTKISIITMVGPRLVDPRSKMEYFVGLFRFAEEKSAVEEILKARTQTMNAAMFTKVSVGPVLSGGRNGGRGGPLGGGGRGGGANSHAAHKRGVSDIAAITFSAEQEELKAEAADKLLAEKRMMQQYKSLNKSRSDPSFQELDEVTPISTKQSLSPASYQQFKSADPLSASSVPNALLCNESPNSVTATANNGNCNEDLEVARINAPATPIQPISIAARAPVVKSSIVGRDSKRVQPNTEKSPVNPASNTSSVNGHSPKPLAGTGSGRYSVSGRAPGGLAEELDAGAAPSAATIKKLNRRPSSNSMAALLAAEAAAAGGGGQVLSGAAAAAALLLADSDDEPTDSACGVSAWIRRGSSNTAASTTSSVDSEAAIGRGTVEKLRSSFLAGGISSQPIRCMSDESAGSTASLASSVAGSHTSPGVDRIPRPPRTRWTQSISSSSATLAATATSPGVRPDVIVRRYSSTLGGKSTGSDDSCSISSSAAAALSSSAGGGGGSLSNDIANRCAAVLKMDKATFLSLPSQGPVRVAATDLDEDNYSFVELVRRNFTKEYQGLVQSDLEKYLTDEEFLTVFLKDKSQFYTQPRWKQMEQKKKSMLF